MRTTDRLWWEREGLGYVDGRLHFAGHDLQALAARRGTPCFVFSGTRVRANLRLDFDYVTRKPGYTVFGRVVEGMDVVDGISLTTTATVAGFDDVPTKPIVIESAERVP